METVFLKLFNMSITASWLVLAVLILRVLLKKAPKSLRCVLWALVGIRLVCPFSFESALSLIPSAQTVPESVISGPSFDIQTGVEGVDMRVNNYLGDRYFEGVSVPARAGSTIMSVFTLIWLVGLLIMAVYTIVSYRKLHRKVNEAVNLKDNIWLCDSIATPFILGVFRPRIFLPSAIHEKDISYVTAHEKAHLKRHDHWWKPLGFALLSVYWFNPVLWIAYILLCRDIELACDERVLKDLGTESKKPYAEALIDCSVSRKTIAACPLAFGETDIHGRIKSVLRYKKPAFLVSLVAVIACIAVTVCFLTDPKGIQLKDLTQVDAQLTSVTVSTENGSYEMTAKESMAYARNFMNEMRVNRTAISANRSEDRPKTNTITFRYTAADTDGWEDSYYFNSDCTEVWFCDSVKPTLTHKVKHPEIIRQFFDSHIETLCTGVIPTEGLSLEIVSAEFSGKAPYMDVKWINNSEKDLDFGEMFCIYKEVNGAWERCEFPENYGFDLPAYLLPAYSSRVKRYDLGVLDITQPGKYLFESRCSFKRTDSDTGALQNYNVCFEFELQENADGGISYTAKPSSFPGTIANPTGDFKAYSFTDSVDSMAPTVLLSEADGTFQFTYSVLSSSIAYGQYELTDKTLTLRNDDGESTYVFRVQGDSFVFDASKSSKIPKYRYSANADAAECPVPDGAVFAPV